MDSNNDPDILKIIKIGEKDTPRSLAEHFYGDASKFQIILDCNDFPGEKWKEKWKVGIEIKIPRLPVPLEEVPVRENSRLVTRDVANLEGRKLLRENVGKLYGVSDAAAQVLKDQLKITSIFDLAMSHYFNSALRLVDPATPLEAAFVQHGFVPGDTVQSDPSQLKVSVLADDDIGELHFENAATVDQLKAELPITTVDQLKAALPITTADQLKAALQITIVDQLKAALQITIVDKLKAALPITTADQLKAALQITTADQLKAALQITTIRDMALWPPFQNARQILLATFDPMELTRRGEDPEAPSDLVPACGNFPTECVYYTSVFLDEIDEPKDGDTPLKDLSDPTFKGVSLFGDDSTKETSHNATVVTPSTPTAETPNKPTIQGFTRPARGGILTYRQSWYAQGVTLGQLLHSLALAPGESTRIAMVDWYRRIGEKTTEEIAESEALSQTSQQARSISEITSAVATEMQHGNNLSAAASLSARAGVGGFGWAVGVSSSASVATSVSSSFGQRNMAADMNQQIRNCTQQNATAERSRRATIVRECYQEEKETLTTRAVTNYNHMHALTVQYYEVVQVYRVRTEVCKAERVLFIPMSPINFSDSRVLVRYKELLKSVAVNEEIRNKLDALNRSSYIDLALASGIVKQIYCSKDLRLKSIKYTSNIELARIKVFKTDKVDGVLRTYERELANQSKEGTLADLNIAIDEMGEIDFEFKDIPANGRTTLESRPVCSITCEFIDTGGPLSTVTVDALHPDFERGYDKFKFDPVAVLKKVRYVPALEAGEVEALKQHLSENLHYSHAIWLSLDSLTLSQMLAGYKYGDEGKPLSSQVDPRPVAITGNYLGFRWPAGTNEVVDTDDDGTSLTWQDKFMADAKKSIEETEIPLPSGGVFAEAVLGRFNSAEKLDITRYWNWQDSPIPFTASDIAALSAGGRSEQSTLTPGQLSQPAVSINTAPSLPDPTGMRDMMQAIAVSNMFRDMSNQAATAALAGQGLEIASKGAGEAAEQASENYRTAVKTIGEVAKEVIPLVATGGLSGASISKAGAAANLAGKIDEKKGKSTDGNGTGSQQTVLKSIIGGVTKAAETEKGETEE